ncbi:MAG: FAD:protein FMN transferase [Anaerolineales bacterium]|nr:FAD:protein FMN transferase [Anaerolineales bacterium]
MANNQSNFKRKDFLRIVAAAGAVGAAAKIGLGELLAPARVSDSRVLMGTLVNLTLVGEDRGAARKALEGCFSKMSALEGVLSRYQRDSQLSILNAVGEFLHPDPALVQVIKEAIEISQKTEGKFDITVQPVLDLFESYHQRGVGLPPEDQVQQALSLVNYRKITAGEDKVSFQTPGMGISLDGIAKGFIVDQGLEVLQQAGFSRLLVEAGGDLAASGRNSRDQRWKIGVLAPRDEQAQFTSKVSLADQALATSGDYQKYYTPDLKHHHIIDPTRGYSPPELASATVVAPTGMSADGYATALMVLGVEKGWEIMESIPDVEALMVTKTGLVKETSGFGALAG